MHNTSTDGDSSARYEKYERKGMARWWIIGVVILAVVVVGFMMLPDVGSRGATQRAISINNAKQIALAMCNYAMVYRTLPPAYIADAEGEPLVSWRTLLLSMLEENKAFSAYDQSEAWNSPHNSPVAAQEIDLYQSPRDSKTVTSGRMGITNYVVVTGADTIFPDEKGIRLETVALHDGTRQTILIVEILDSDIAWAEPRDLTVDEFLERVRQGKNFKGPNRLGDHCVIAFADASVRAIPLADLSEADARAMLTRAAGDKIRMHFD